MTELDQSLKVAVAKDPEVRVTVVICTLNRADVIGDALRSVVGQTVAPSSLEILVVDNGSTDGTPELVTQLARPHEHVRLLHEPTLGLSAARNRGAAEARGMIVAYLDDDAIADPRWVESLLATYAEEPEAVAVGGPISLSLPNGQPTWAPRRALAAWGQLDLGPNRLEVHGLHGGNMSLRRDVLVEAGGFDPRLG